MIGTSGQLLQDGNYIIEKPLGKGGFGVTYLAKMNDGQFAVIKTLNDSLRGRRDFAKFQQDFIREARRLSQCTHPHIVKILVGAGVGALLASSRSRLVRWCEIVAVASSNNSSGAPAACPHSGNFFFILI